MAKKQDAYYFDTFRACVDDACKAAAILVETMSDYHPETLSRQLQAVHVVEHAADCRKHAMMEVLSKAFITAIERVDIITLAHNIDNMVDKIEDVLMRLYCNNIQTLRPDALATAKLIQKACTAVAQLMKDFSDFKRAKTLSQHIIDINSLEEEADAAFLHSVRQLHVGCTDALEVFSWHEVYRYLEQCMDACEHVADTVESVVMKNS